jgi:hypothetical protein
LVSSLYPPRDLCNFFHISFIIDSFVFPASPKAEKNLIAFVDNVWVPQTCKENQFLEATEYPGKSNSAKLALRALLAMARNLPMASM